MAKKIIYNPLTYQEKFQDSEKAKVYLSTGYGGGKSFALIMKMLKLCNQNRGLPGGLLCPTIKMFKRDILPIVKDICRENRLPYHYHKSDYYFTFPTTRSMVWVFHDQDQGESIKGPNLAFMCINEASLCSEDGFKAALSRVRLKKAPRLQVILSGTPAEFNWVYEYFLENPREDTDFIMGDMRENIHIHEDYAQMLIDSYDPVMQEQYVEGKYVSRKGKRAAYAFDRRIHHDKKIIKEPLRQVWVSVDFNVDPMGAVLWNRMSPKSTRWVQAFDEITIPSSDTYELCDAINEKLEPDDDVIIFPDPAGNARSTKTRGKTDISILKDYGKFEQIKFKGRIQSVRDCLNSLNNLFAKDRIAVHPRCKDFTADLEQCKIKEGTFEIDKSNHKRSHWLDGAKNMADYMFPIRSRTKHWTMKTR